MVFLHLNGKVFGLVSWISVKMSGGVRFGVGIMF